MSRELPRVVRGDELLRQHESPGFTFWRCELHGNVKPVLILDHAQLYLICPDCIYSSPDIPVVHEAEEAPDGE